MLTEIPLPVVGARTPPSRQPVSVDYRLRKLVIKPSLACTANCPTCAHRRELYRAAKRQRTLSLDEWKTILAEARGLGVERLDISGGEPTLYPALRDLVRMGRSCGWHVGLNTNGGLITETSAEELLRAGVNSVSISLYSSKPGVHDSMRRARGLWKKATNAVRILKAMEPQFPDFEVLTQTIICRENYREFPELLDLHFQVGSHGVGIAYLEGDFERKYLLTAGEIRYFKEAVIPKALLFCDRLSPGAAKHARRILQNMFSEDVLDISEWARGEYRPIHRNPPPCVRPQEFALVLANGDVHPCNMIEYTHEPIMGNVFAHSLADIWRSERWNIFRTRLFDKCTLCPINLYLGISLAKAKCAE